MNAIQRFWDFVVEHEIIGFFIVILLWLPAMVLWFAPLVTYLITGCVVEIAIYCINNGIILASVIMITVFAFLTTRVYISEW